jgi:hypothetical protein
MESSWVPITMKRELVSDANQELQEELLEKKALREMEIIYFFVEVHGPRVLAKLIETERFYPGELTAFVTHNDVNVRQSIANYLKRRPPIPNDNTVLELLQTLSHDPNESVRTTAKEAFDALQKA